MRSLLAAAGAVLLPRAASAGEAASLRIGVVLPTTGARASSAARGVELGGEEAARTGRLMGQDVQMRRLGTRPTTRELRNAGVVAVVGGFDLDGFRALADTASSAGILLLNVGCDADEARGAACESTVFHVAASARMKKAALRQGRGSASTAIGAELWNPALERFGAGQLNDRFRIRFARPMDGAAWAGWFALKLLAESSLRARTVEPALLAAHLSRASTQFDGHKGWPLTFRSGDHQLRQPLYLVDAKEALVGEIPVRGADEETPLAVLLDRTTGPEPAGACPAPARRAP